MVFGDFVSPEPPPELVEAFQTGGQQELPPTEFPPTDWERLSPKEREGFYPQFAERLITGYVQSGFWTIEEAIQALATIRAQIRDFGIQTNTLLYREVTQQSEAELLRARRGFEERGALGKVQRESVLKARSQLDAMVDIVLRNPWDYEDKRDTLLDLYRQFQEKAMLPEGYGRDLVNAAFESLPPEEQVSRRGDIEAARLERRPRFPATTRAPELAPRFAPAFEQVRAGLQGTQRWKQYFEQRYGSLLRQFRAGLPTDGQPTKDVETNWAEFLRKRKPQLKEEWWKTGAFVRGERPSAFAPRIQTVKF